MDEFFSYRRRSVYASRPVRYVPRSRYIHADMTPSERPFRFRSTIIADSHPSYTPSSAVRTPSVVRRQRRKATYIAVATIVVALSLGMLRMLAGGRDVHQKTFLPVATITTHAIPIQHVVTHNALPVRLMIPKIKINVALDYVGLTKSGALGTPTGPTTAGWFDRGPSPGENGSAVIDGHSGWKDNIPAVFDNLGEIRPGDVIYVKDDRGVTITFIVRDTKSYTPSESTPAVFAASANTAHLNLITCEGVWNAAQKSYSNRLVVFADKAA